MVFPTAIAIHAKSRTLEMTFDDGFHCELPAEFLRVYSPSAEVQGHGPGEEQLQVGKRDVALVSAQPVGNYALQLTFTDGHNSGLYSWDYLHDIGQRQEDLWHDYLSRLTAAGKSRDPDDPRNGPATPPPKHSCHGGCR